MRLESDSWLLRFVADHRDLVPVSQLEHLVRQSHEATVATPGSSTALCEDQRVAASTQRRALGVLFVVLTSVFGAVAVAAGAAGQWVIAAAAAALGVWMAGLALRSLR